MRYTYLKLKEALEIQDLNAKSGNFFNIKRDSYGSYYLLPCSCITFVTGFPVLHKNIKRSVNHLNRFVGIKQ